jgi:hypothetical protein
LASQAEKEQTVKHLVRFRAVALAILATLLLVPAANAYSWEKFKEDFKYKPVAFVIALPAFIITAPLILVDEMMEDDD